MSSGVSAIHRVLEHITLEYWFYSSLLVSERGLLIRLKAQNSFNQVLQELRTIAIYDNTKEVKIFFIVLDVAAGIAFVVLRKIQPTKSARKISLCCTKSWSNSHPLARIHDSGPGAFFRRGSDNLFHVLV